MKYLVVYDTAYGNTAAVAAAIREGLGADASAREVETLKPEDMKGVDLLVVGSPTQGGRPTGSTMDWVQSLPFVHDSDAAVFDTRLGGDEVAWLPRVLMGAIGYAAPRIAKTLASKGYSIVGDQQGFVVTAKEGPLQDGELARARKWGQELARRRGTLESRLKGSSVPAG